MLKTIFARIAFIACVLSLSATAAFAHAHPVTMMPAKDSTVSAPANVSVTFSEALEPKFSSLVLQNDKGSQISKASSVLDPADSKHMTLALPTLAPGLYIVRWVTVALDGHRLEGSYSFTVK